MMKLAVLAWMTCALLLWSAVVLVAEAGVLPGA